MEQPEVKRSEEEIMRDLEIIDKRTRKWVREMAGIKGDRPKDPRALDRIRAIFAKEPYVVNMTLEELENLVQSVR